MTAPPQTKARRLTELDILRGFLLLGMTLTHLPTLASAFFNQALGFVSDAEGFIFLSAFMFGQVQERVHRKRGESGVLRDMIRRTWRVYLYQCSLLAIAFTVVAEAGLRFHRLALENLLAFYLDDPPRALLAAALLEYRPALLDILPMYIVFMLITPIVRKTAHRFGWRAVIGTSFIVWVAAQFGLRAWLFGNFYSCGLRVPEDAAGAFDLYGWQLLWMAGLALGSIYTGRPSVSPTNTADSVSWMPHWLVSLGCMIVIIFLILRHLPFLSI